MSSAKIAITLNQETVEQLDRMVARRIFPNRSRAIQQAVTEKLQRLEKTRLARECAKLDPRAEKALAEEGMSEELDKWPAY